MREHQDGHESNHMDLIVTITGWERPHQKRIDGPTILIGSPRPPTVSSS